MSKTGPGPLLFLWLLRYVTANLEPPANVTVHCHNLHNFVEWGYSQHMPGLQFEIEIRPFGSGNPKAVLVDSPTYRADLPSLSDLTDSYLVIVTALFGQNTSGPTPPDGIAFSYYTDSIADKKCFLDLPSVNVTAAEHSKVLISFTHPWMLYGDRLPSSMKKSRREKSHQAPVKLPVFVYDVKIKNQGQETRLTCNQSQCEGSVFGKAEQGEHCLTISGDMEKVTFKATQVHCVTAPIMQPQQNNHTYVLIIAISLLLGGAFVLFMVFWKCTSPSSPIPSSMLFRSPPRQFNFREGRETVCVAEQEPCSPTPLLTTTQELTPSVTPTTEPDLRLPIGVSTTGEDVCDVVEEERDQEAGYMPGHSLEDDETESSGTVSTGYERRTCIVNLGSDENAEGYRGRNAD